MNLDAKAPDASAKRGISFVATKKRVCSWPVHAFLYFRSIVNASSPLMESRRSVMASWRLLNQDGRVGG